MMPTMETMRARFAELTAQVDAVRATTGPMRDERDALVHSIAEQVRALDSAIADAEAGLFAAEQERALISRALGGKTGVSDSE